MEYLRRVVDAQLDALLAGLPAVSLEGVKGVGKTATAARRVISTLALDRGRARRTIAADPEILLTQPTPLLVDEWQLAPEVWDVVRRAVDRDRSPGRYLLAGSALPPREARIHSGAGRIVRLTMRPMTLPERGVVEPTVSLAGLLSGDRPEVEGTSDLGLDAYAEEITASGLPGVRRDPAGLRGDMLASYIDQIVDREIPELGAEVRRPGALRAWLAAYAAATATTASYTAILDSATPGQPDKPGREAADSYRALLERIWVLDPLEAWIPAFNPLKRLAQAPKHHLADPALAASLLGATRDSLLRADGPAEARREDALLAALFESLAVLTVRVLAQPNRARVCHLRTHRGEREVDIIVERPDHKVVGIEVKLSSAPTARDVRHLNWLEDQIGDALADKVVLCPGQFAHRRPDGVAVVPLALLGP
jgi:predicted AAA+ superfamily ATPase